MVARPALVDKVANIKAKHHFSRQPGRMAAMQERLQARFASMLPSQLVSDYLKLMTETAIQREEAQI